MILYFKIHHIRMVNVVTYLHKNGNIFLNNEKNLIINVFIYKIFKYIITKANKEIKKKLL